METINILYIGRNAEILDIVIRLINSNDNWNGVGMLCDEKAKQVFMQTNFSIVLLGPGIEQERESELRSYFTKVNPTIKIVQHYGGGSGLLQSEILSAIAPAENR